MKIKEIQYISPNLFVPKDAWDKLSMAEKSEMMKVAVRNGITDLKTIKEKYNEFADGGRKDDGWTLEDENKYQLWRASLPDNLKNTNDNTYDMRAAFKAGMQPVLLSDGYYHLGSRDPETGRILKAPYHPTYLQAINTDARLGYYPIVDEQGNTYTQTWSGNQFGGGGKKNPGYIYDELPRLLREAGLDIRVSSGYRPAGKVGTSGKRSWHWRHGAVDIVPQGKTTFADIENAIYSNPTIYNYMLSNNFGLLDESGRSPESRATMRRTGATGPHFHFGRDSKPAYAYAQKMAGILGNTPSTSTPTVTTQPVVPYRAETPQWDNIPFTPVNPAAFFNIPVATDQPVVDMEPTKTPVLEYDPKEVERQEKRDNLRRFNMLLSILDGSNESIFPFSMFAEGGGIHIKPENRGKFTALKERTGHSATWFKEHGTPAQKKMATFALNSRHWKHGDGGNLFDDGGDANIFKYTNPSGEVRYVYQATPDSEEITVHPQSTIFPDPAQWTFVDDNGRTYTPRVSTPVPTAELNPDNRTGFERALDNYIGEATNTVPKGYHTLPAIGAAAFGLTSPALGEAALTSGFAAHGLTKALNGEVNGPLDAAITAAEILPLGQLTKPMLNTGVEVLEKYPALYQYPRYAVGKFKYGFDTQLPTLYRKVKNLPKIEDGRIMVSNPRSRFAFDNGYGEESPVITNFTTDAPVRSHSSGNWDRGLTLAFPGKTLLGKNVISTRPSDTFTFGNNISVPVGDVTAFTGRPKEISFLQNSGVKTISSPDAEVFWKSGAADLADKIAKARATNAKIFSKRGSGIPLLKPKTPVDNFDNYATTIENLARETFRSPTARDYEFMDYVFKPLYRSETIPKINDFTIQALDNYPALGEWIGNSERRRYLEDPWRWENLMYDPLTPIESEFRNNLNIGLKPEFKK